MTELTVRAQSVDRRLQSFRSRDGPPPLRRSFARRLRSAAFSVLCHVLQFPVDIGLVIRDGFPVTGGLSLCGPLGTPVPSVLQFRLFRFFGPALRRSPFVQSPASGRPLFPTEASRRRGPPPWPVDIGLVTRDGLPVTGDIPSFGALGATRPQRSPVIPVHVLRARAKASCRPSRHSRGGSSGPR